MPGPEPVRRRPGVVQPVLGQGDRDQIGTTLVWPVREALGFGQTPDPLLILMAHNPADLDQEPPASEAWGLGEGGSRHRHGRFAPARGEVELGGHPRVDPVVE